MLSSLYHLHAIIIRPKDSRCYWLSFTYGDCYLLKNMTNLFVFLIYAGTAVFSLERVINTITYPSKRTKKLIAITLVVLQFLSPLIVVVRSIPFSSVTTSHCSRIFPNLIELKQFYFILVGIEFFSLAVYSALLLHGFSLTMESRMKRMSFQVHESMMDTQITFPIVMASIAFFVVNLGLDRNFWIMFQSLFNQSWIQENRTIAIVAFWNELQSLSVPIFSLIFFVLTVRHAWKVDSDRIYEKAVSECAQGLKIYYETLNIQKSPNIRRTKSSEDVYKVSEKSPESEEIKSKTLPNYHKNSTKVSPEAESEI